MSLKILLVEDDKSQRKMMSLLLGRKLGYTLTEAEDGPTALAILQGDTENKIQLVLLDIEMPQMNGLEVLNIVTQKYPYLPVIMLTGNTDISIAVKALQNGACDFINKTSTPERLQVSIQNALQMKLLKKEVSRLQRKENGAFSFQDLIGYDRGISSIINIGRKAAAADIPVMITGETGVGKEVFARAIHGEGLRGGKPFIAVNCGALPGNLVESILFGHEKGAFTGAINKTLGKFREANGGTIFLDEIGELPIDTQVKILRVLQQKEINPLGAKGSIPINARIISATNLNLETAVAEGRFREDLYFRLNVLPIHMPPLHERTEDIPELVTHFIERFAANEGLQLKEVTAKAINMLCKRKWSGNVRELENTIHRAIVLSDSPLLNVEDFSMLPTNNAAPEKSEDITNETESSQLSFIDNKGKLKTMAEIESKAIEFSLAHHGNNVTRAANELGMAKATFYRKLRQLNKDL